MPARRPSTGHEPNQRALAASCRLLRLLEFALPLAGNEAERVAAVAATPAGWRQARSGAADCAALPLISAVWQACAGLCLILKRGRLLDLESRSWKWGRRRWPLGCADACVRARGTARRTRGSGQRAPPLLTRRRQKVSVGRTIVRRMMDASSLIKQAGWRQGGWLEGNTKPQPRGACIRAAQANSLLLWPMRNTFFVRSVSVCLLRSRSYLLCSRAPRAAARGVQQPRPHRRRCAGPIHRPARTFHRHPLADRIPTAIDPCSPHQDRPSEFVVLAAALVSLRHAALSQRSRQAPPEAHPHKGRRPVITDCLSTPELLSCLHRRARLHFSF